MTPQIQIDEDVFDVLKQRAVPFEDHDPNDVLRRLLLGADQSETKSGEDPGSARTAAPGTPTRTSRTSTRSKSGKRRRAASSTLMPESEYRLPILRALSENGGRMPTREVITAVGDLVHDKLLPADLEMLRGKPRWEGRVQFTRLELIRDGLMKENSPRGVWEISDAGADAVRRQGQSDSGSTANPKRVSTGAM